VQPSDSTKQLVDEQAALRRVATLVASSPNPERVFGAVAEEAGRLLGARSAATVRFSAEGGVVVGRWNVGTGVGFEVGTLVPHTDPAGATARLAQRGGRIDDYTDLPGESAAMMRAAGFRSAVAAPITAGGRIWGSLFVVSADEPLAADAERRLRDFAELVALALESAETHDQLTASRARIVEASMTERRRLERNLHDGAQQRLVTATLHLRLAQESLGDQRANIAKLLEDVGDDLKHALAELQELARGLHPAILSDRGLVPALQTLANRAPFPVEISGVPQLRLPDAIEAAIYFLVAETLTNAAKHSGASEAQIELSTTKETVSIIVRDNGAGGANLSDGSGLRGLADRIEALGGEFDLQAPQESGTAIRAQLPLN
jgi:signal transduction histidine kinase